MLSIGAPKASLNDKCAPPEVSAATVNQLRISSSKHHSQSKPHNVLDGFDIEHHGYDSDNSYYDVHSRSLASKSAPTNPRQLQVTSTVSSGTQNQATSGRVDGETVGTQPQHLSAQGTKTGEQQIIAKDHAGKVGSYGIQNDQEVNDFLQQIQVSPSRPTPVASRSSSSSTFTTTTCCSCHCSFLGLSNTTRQQHRTWNAMQQPAKVVFDETAQQRSTQPLHCLGISAVGYSRRTLLLVLMVAILGMGGFGSAIVQLYFSTPTSQTGGISSNNANTTNTTMSSTSATTVDVVVEHNNISRNQNNGKK